MALQKKPNNNRKKTNSRVPPHQQRAGRCPATSKVAFPSEITARLEAKRMRKLRGPKLLPYQCPFCPFWHIGHSRTVERRKAKVQNVFHNVNRGINLLKP